MGFEAKEQKNTGVENVNQLEQLAKVVDPEKTGKDLDSKNKDQQLGLAEKMPNDKINNIVNFVNKNNALVTEYTITGIADGHLFEDGGPNAQAIRKQCGDLIRELGERMVLPTEYQAEYLININNKTPNEVLALTRALLVLSQLPQETLNKISSKLSRDIHTENVKAGEYRTGALSAYAPSGTFDMTEENVVEIEKKKLGDIQENEEVQLERKKILLREELKNILPRIDFVMQMKNPKNEKEVWYFQKQVNTDGTSKTGWYPITSTTYNFAQKRVNVKDIGTQEGERTTRLNNIRSNVIGKGKYDAILDILNKEEDKNRQVRKEAANTFLADLAENPSPQMEAFIEKVEKALGKGGFKTLMRETYTLEF